MAVRTALPRCEGTSSSPAFANTDVTPAATAETSASACHPITWPPRDGDVQRASQREAGPPAFSSQRLQVLDELAFLSGRQPQLEMAVVVLHHGRQVGGAAVVKIRRMLQQATQRRGPV